MDRGCTWCKHEQRTRMSGELSCAWDLAQALLSDSVEAFLSVAELHQLQILYFQATVQSPCHQPVHRNVTPSIQFILVCHCQGKKERE